MDPKETKAIVIFFALLAAGAIYLLGGGGGSAPRLGSQPEDALDRGDGGRRTESARGEPWGAPSAGSGQRGWTDDDVPPQNPDDL